MRSLLAAMVRGWLAGWGVGRVWAGCRHDICHKHHKQRLCKIISTWVTFYFVNVGFEHGYVFHCGFWK